METCIFSPLRRLARASETFRFAARFRLEITNVFRFEVEIACAVVSTVFTDAGFFFFVFSHVQQYGTAVGYTVVLRFGLRRSLECVSRSRRHCGRAVYFSVFRAKHDSAISCVS